MCILLKYSNLGGGLYEYCKKGCYLIEEIIIQHEAISKLYPHSINTIRFFTFYGNIIGAVIRMGRRGAMIDNASSGGIYAELDIESGRIISPAYTFQNQMYQKHPDTNVFFMGFEIPLWDSCTELIAKACERLKGIPLTGWDIALTPTKPVIVEVNAQPEIPLLQIPRKHGVRRLIIENNN